MENDNSLEQSALIHTTKHRLAEKESELIKRGLGLVRILSKKRLNVVIGNFCDPINELISYVLFEVAKDQYDVRIKIIFSGEEILELTKQQSVDIFIIIMNNIFFEKCDVAPDRFEKSLHLISQIKSSYRKPIICLSGWKKDPDIKEKAKANSDFYLDMPFKIEALKKAIKGCINRFGGPRQTNILGCRQ